MSNIWQAMEDDQSEAEKQQDYNKYVGQTLTVTTSGWGFSYRESRRDVLITEYSPDGYDGKPGFRCAGKKNPEFNDYVSVESFFDTTGRLPPLPEENVSYGHTDSPADEFDMVSKPNHYQLFPEYSLEVKHINKRLLDKIGQSDFDMSLYEAGWYQQAMQYLMRFHTKNGLEDIKKGIQTLQFVVDSMEERGVK